MSMLSIVFSLTACANLNTISRSTGFPEVERREKQTIAVRDGDGNLVEDWRSDKYSSEVKAKAVHLDIQQRLMVMNGLGVYCAEPSPDGLAAYAAAIGLSASNPANNAIAAAGNGGSNAASIGLRTQSITLMRDAMYRVCEAYANGQIGKAQVATLLGRSQDLTAVILAVEQLTGPIAAEQVALTTTTDAAASASLIAIADQLELAIRQVELSSKRLEEVTTEKAEVDNKISELNIEIPAKETVLSNISQSDNPVEYARAQSELNVKKDELKKLETRSATLGEIIPLRAKAHESAIATKNEIEKKQETAFASANSGTSGSQNITSRASTTRLNDNSSTKITEAVKEIVLSVVQKPYISESCLSILTLSADETQGMDKIKESCNQLVEAEIKQRTEQANLARARAVEAAAEIQVRTSSLLGGESDKLTSVSKCISESGILDKMRLGAVLEAAKQRGLDTGEAQYIFSVANLTELMNYLSAGGVTLDAIWEAAQSLDTCGG